MKRFKHSLSYYNLFSADMGNLTPIGLTEVLPGDTLNMQTSALIRVSPLVTPVMHPVVVRIHHFFVPHRIVMPEFEDFITGGADGNDTTTIPVTTSASSQGDLLDYMGVPPGTTGVSILPIRGYNKIWNEFFRDQDLQDESNVDNNQVRKCAWEKDYFCAARPFLQKGDAVTIPLGNTAPVYGLGGTASSGNNTNGTIFDGRNAPGGTSVDNWRNITNTSTGLEVDSSGNAQMYADLSSATGADINDVRKAFALQRYKEARARYGSRYTEYLAYLGVRSSDQRLQRPEYLAGGKQTISFSEVLLTGASTTRPVGELSGHGIAALRSNRFRKFFSEHGYVHTLMSVRPKSMYADSIPKHFLYETKEDFYQRELETIGQQEILNKEVKHDHGTPNGVFGYANRYEQYRRTFSRVSGEMRDVLDSWHLARTFDTDPALNGQFVRCEPSKRIHASQDNNVLWCTANHSIQARRMVNKSAASRII